MRARVSAGFEGPDTRQSGDPGSGHTELLRRSVPNSVDQCEECTRTRTAGRHSELAVLGRANAGHGTPTERGALSWPVIRGTPTTVGNVLRIFSGIAQALRNTCRCCVPAEVGSRRLSFELR